MFLHEARLVFAFCAFGVCFAALKLSPALNETERYINDSYVVTCFGENASGARWIGPENVPISSGVGRIHTEEKNDYVSLIFESILRHDSGNYVCVRDDERVSFKLTVVKPIKFQEGLEEQYIVVGGSDQVKCEAEGIPQPSFIWHINGSIIQGRRYTRLPSGLHIMNVTRADNGVYLCRAYQVTTQTSIVMDQLINVSVHYKPIWKHSQDWYGFLGGTANLTCEVEADPPANFTWTQNNQTLEAPRIITEPNRSILQINVTDETAFGTYECRAWNKLGNIRRTGELKEGSKPKPPSNVKIDPSAGGSIKLAVAWANNDHNHLGIRVEFLESSALPETWENASYKDLLSENGPYELKDLKTNTNYILRVATLGLAGLSDFAEEVKFVTNAGIIVTSSHIVSSLLVLLSAFNYFLSM